MELIPHTPLRSDTKLSHDELRQVAIFQVTPEHIRALKAAGYDKLTLEERVASRIHGITPRFVAEVKGLGFTNPTLDELMSMRIHRIDGNSVRSLSKNKGSGRKE